MMNLSFEFSQKFEKRYASESPIHFPHTLGIVHNSSEHLLAQDWGKKPPFLLYILKILNLLLETYY